MYENRTLFDIQACRASAILSTRNRTRVTTPASNSRLIKAAAVRVLPVPVAISTSSLRVPRETSADSAAMHSIW